MYQEDVAIAPVVGPAVQPDVPKPAEASSQAFSSPPLRLHPFHWMYKLQYYAIFSQNDASDACNNVGSSCWPTRQQAIKGIDGIDFDEDAASK